MGLHWTIDEIKDYKEVCWRQLDNGEYVVGAITESMIWRTMGVGIGRITNENAREFTIRSRMFDYATNSFPITRHDPETDTYNGNHFTYEEVLAHVGLQTNVTNWGRDEFYQNLVSNHLEPIAEAHVTREVERMAASAIGVDLAHKAGTASGKIVEIAEAAARKADEGPRVPASDHKRDPSDDEMRAEEKTEEGGHAPGRYELPEYGDEVYVFAYNDWNLGFLVEFDDKSATVEWRTKRTRKVKTTKKPWADIKLRQRRGGAEFSHSSSDE